MNTANTSEQVNILPEEWTMILRPKRNLLDINLHELWQYRDLIMLFVKRDFVSKFKQTILGPLWFIIQPLLTTIMFTIIFGNIAGIPTDGIPKILFYMTGIVGWTYFSTCLNDTSQTFIKNASIFGKVYFPRLALPISVVISNLVSFVIQFLFLCLFLAYFMIKGSDFSPCFMDSVSGPTDGGPRIGIWHHHIFTHHQIPRPDTPCYFWCNTLDVRHSDNLSLI